MSKKKGGAVSKLQTQTVQPIPVRPVLTISRETDKKPAWYNETKRQLAKRDTRIGPARSR